MIWIGHLRRLSILISTSGRNLPRGQDCQKPGFKCGSSNRRARLRKHISSSTSAGYVDSVAYSTGYVIHPSAPPHPHAGTAVPTSHPHPHPHPQSLPDAAFSSGQVSELYSSHHASSDLSIGGLRDTTAIDY